MNINKKSLLSFCVVCLFIILSGKLAFAVGYNYSARLPETGAVTWTGYKDKKDNYADNYIKSIGWSGSEIAWWIRTSSSKTNMTQYKCTESIGLSQGQYIDGYNNYIGNVEILIKTGPKTWHPCDVTGTLYT